MLTPPAQAGRCLVGVEGQDLVADAQVVDRAVAGRQVEAEIDLVVVEQPKARGNDDLLVADLEAADITCAGLASPLDVLDTPIVGKVLWARSATELEARRFVRAMGGTCSVYGHDVIPEGYEKVGDEQIIVSTSFGLFDQNKVYLSLDLSHRYRNVHDLRVGHEILPLYPDKAPPRLGGRAKSSGS